MLEVTYFRRDRNDDLSYAHAFVRLFRSARLGGIVALNLWVARDFETAELDENAHDFQLSAQALILLTQISYFFSVHFVNARKTFGELSVLTLERLNVCDHSIVIHF